MAKKQQTAIIVGAGPAGLTAALELLDKTDIKPIIYEASGDIGGISKTVRYKDNRIDIGGHRFFSKSDRIMDWWERILPIQHLSNETVKIKYHGSTRNIESKGAAPDPDKDTNVMLLRSRLSRIYYNHKFFDYPISLNLTTIKNLGLGRMVVCGFSYLRAQMFPIRSETTLEDFLINRFGRQLYLTFFKDYTEKVWGVDCREISAEWGAQRIKGLTINKAIRHALRSKLPRRSKQGIAQKDIETSLIEYFLYPKYGPGQLWEVVAQQIEDRGGEIHTHHEVIGLTNKGNKIAGVKIRDRKSGALLSGKANYYFSTMPVKELVNSLEGDTVPGRVQKIANGLMYRDFITVGLLLNKLNPKVNLTPGGSLIPDNWIYIQEKDVKVGRLQIFNNWSPYMVKDSKNIWLGLEYFVNEGDELWQKTDKAIARLGIEELSRIGFIDPESVCDSVVVRMKKAYPAYFGTYKQFGIVRKYIDNYDNLFLIGRNGMHRYNNQDHSMLTAMKAVENIINNVASKDAIWDINTEEQYHEAREA